MFLRAEEIPIFLSSYQITSLTKTREFPLIEWRGEAGDKYIIIRYSDSFVYIGVADNDIEAVSNITPVVSGLSSNIKEIAEYFKFKLPENYVEFY